MPQLLATAGKTPSGKTLTPAMIGQAVETFPSVGTAPLSLSTHVKGHQVYLKAGEVTALSANADNTKLYGDISFAPALQGEDGAVAGGLLDDRSIGLLPGADGFYLSHVALLGGIPPAIKGMPALTALESLEEAVFSDALMDPSAGALWFSAEGEPVAFSAFNDTFLTRILDAEIARVMAEEDVTREEVIARMASEAGHESAVSVMHVLNGEMTPRDEWLEGYARALGISKTTLIEARYMYSESNSEPTETPPQPTDSPMPEPKKPSASPAQTATPDTPPTATSQPEAEPAGASAVQFTDTPEYQSWLEERRDSETLALRQAASGKMPPPLIDELVTFSERLPEDRLDFSEKQDGSDKRSLRRVLTALVGKLPDMVPQSGFVFSESDDPNKETQEVLAKAVTKF